MRTSALSLAVSFALILAAAAQTTTTWTNTGTDWATEANWSSGIPDTNTEKAVFGPSGSPQNPNLAGNFTIQGITFNSTAANYTFGGSGVLTIDANAASATNSVQVNGTQTFDVDITTTNTAGGAQRFVIGTAAGGVMNFGAGRTLTVGTGGLVLQAIGAGTGDFNIYGAVSLLNTALTQQSSQVSVYFREGSSVTGNSSSAYISNSAGNMYFETDNITLASSAQLSMIGSFTSSDAAMYLTRNNLNISENVRIANTGSGGIRTLGVDIAGSGAATWSGNFNISQNTSGADIDRTVRLFAGAGDRAIFSGNIISTSATVFADGLQIDGGGTVVVSGAANTYSAPTAVIAGTTFLANNASGSATGGNAVTVDGILGGTGRLAPSGTNGLLLNAGGVVSPGDGGIESLEVDLSGTTGTATFSPGSTFAFDLGAPGLGDTLIFTGLTTLSGEVAFNGNTVTFTNLGGLASGEYDLFTFDAVAAYTGILSPIVDLGPGFTGVFDYTDPSKISLVVTAIPEPATWGLIGLAAVSASLFHIRRRKKI